MNWLVKLMPIKALLAFESFMLKHYSIAKYLVTSSDPEFFEELSKKKLLHIVKHSAEKVPAYNDFLKQNRIEIDNIRNSEDYKILLPQTTKANYIKKYSYEERCQQGRLPFRGNIDESSGSSGKPTNWIRSIKEEDLLFNAAKFEFNYIFDIDHKDYIVFSAWSTGPWATGVKFCTIIEHFCLVKNTDTNVDNIITTLNTFGPKYNYIIAGYPPFVKHMLDEGKEKINWKKYNIDIITGGEGVILEWVDYVKKMLKPGAKVISSYGASDIDIGIGFETPFAQLLRRRAAKNKKLREALFGHLDRLPMFFQYNPTLHYITNHINEQGRQEFQISLLDYNVVSPKLKYNLHDEGGVLTYNEAISIISKHDLALAKSLRFGRQFDGLNTKEVLKLPFLYIIGRSDGTISLDGANVYPHQIEMCIHSNQTLLNSTKNFRIGAEYDKKENVNFNIRIELKDGVKPNQRLRHLYHDTILNNLMKINSDFKESYINDESVINPQVFLYEHGHSVFEKTSVKNRYIE